jgi:arylsulfatase
MKMEESPNCKSKRPKQQRQLQQQQPLEAKANKGLMRTLIALFLIAALSVTLTTINLVHTVELSNYESDDYNGVSMIDTFFDDFREEDAKELEEQWQQLRQKQQQQQQGRQGQKEENEKQVENNKEVEGDENNEKALKPDSPTTEKDETQKGTKTTPEKLNVLILYPDDWRHDTLGSEKPYVLTPFLDKLATEGIRFTQNAVTTSICWMSRATLFSGQYASRHKSYKIKCPRFSEPQNWEHSWVRILQKAGYFVGHIGKWQYFSPDLTSLFDFYRFSEGKHWENINGVKIHATDLVKDRALSFLDQRPKDKPFALTVAFFPPKAVGTGTKLGEQWSPTNQTRRLYDNVTVPEPEMKESFKKLPKFIHGGEPWARWKQRYSTPERYQASMKNYYALVTGVDQACKDIVDKLKEKGLHNNTMIIFTTDNGMLHGAHGLGGKWYPYQESIRVPLIIYDPRMPAEKVGTLEDSLTLNIDLAETILGAAGIKPDDAMQGRDISDLYLPNNEKNEYHSTSSVKSQPWRDEFFYEFPAYNENSAPSSTALVRKEWKFINWPTHGDRDQLFNLKDDPLELNDLYDNMDDEIVAVRDEMRKRHDEMKKEIFDPTYLKLGHVGC